MASPEDRTIGSDTQGAGQIPGVARTDNNYRHRIFLRNHPFGKYSFYQFFTDWQRLPYSICGASPVGP